MTDVSPHRRVTRTDTPAVDARRLGIALAALTAVVSGFSVFVNGYGVAHFEDATTYTTAKNLVAALAIGVAIAVRRRPDRRQPAGAGDIAPTRRRAALATIAVIGGSIPFVLFFEGLARITSSDAAFIHKTLVVWVGVLGAVLLRERVTPVHALAIVLILAGYAGVAGGVGLPEVGVGEVLILAATLCWAIEVVIARSLLRRGVPEMTVSAWRMVGGVVLLLGWAIVRGAASDLFLLTTAQWGWVLLTGAFLTAYVVSWHHALARAPAVDVTAVLASGAVLTAVLNGSFRAAPIDPTGLSLLLTGGLLVCAVAVLAPSKVATS